MALTRIGSVGLSTGININAGVGTFTGNLTVGGVLTYEDVTNVDSIGIITARAGVKVGSGITLSSDGDIFFTGIITGNGSGLTGVANTDVIFTDKITLPDSSAGSINVGLGSDLQILHNGSDSFIQNFTGDLNIRGVDGKWIYIQAKSGENSIICKEDGAVELYHDNSKKLETASGGVTVTGTLAATAVTGDGSGLTGIGGTDFIHAEQINTTGIVTATTFVPTVGQIFHRNLIINGSMIVAQRATSSTSTNYATVDRYQCMSGGTDEAPTQAQVDIASGTTPYTLGFRKAYRITNGNQTSGAGASDYIYIRQKIEAQNIVQSGWNYTSSSSYITLSFWVKSSVAQNFYGHFKTIDGTGQNYIFETGSLSADTWTKVTKTVPGNSNITIDYNVNQGLELHIAPFYGTNYTDSSSLNTWAAYSSTSKVADMTSTWYTTNDATFELTGVQLEVGPVATPFEHRTYQDELLRCQRYYYAHKGPLWGHVSAGDHLDVALYFPVPMRIAPSRTQVDTTLLFKNRLNQGNSISSSTYDISGATNEYGAMWVARPASGESWDTSSGRIYYFHIPEGTTSYAWSAEL